jgi:D-glycero-alpha-D-manno-heptose-7-phosphate kinase
MLFRGKAPLRVSFGGGGSDVSPYCDTYGGCVLSTTIGMHIYGAMEVRDDREVHIFSLHFPELVQYELGAEIEEGDNLEFVKAVIRRLNPPRGVNLFIHSDAPPGTGLGSSGTLAALIVGLMNQAFNLHLTQYEMADIAYMVEHDDLGRAVGKQDQHAAVFGGMNFMEFSKEGTLVIPLRMESWIMEELVYHCQMFYTRKKRASTDIVAQQVEFYKQERTDTLDALADMKQIAYDMRTALLKGQLRHFGDLLHEGWVQKQKMNPHAVTPYLDELYQAARNKGAIGGKLLGAGGGGYFIMFTPFTRKGEVARIMEEKGAKPMPFLVDFQGLRTWQVMDGSLDDEVEGVFKKH